ncbi:lysophospholipid acyltransferase family protein [Prosthecochloris sp. N3]|uniref:Lysophospholipid acyltransferase family protein n=1 Tax=Prosthecochloris ethylica TaxID=2743976 RepID=A0ABR9XQ62_9CHLB|nr:MULTISPECIES: lysophospholipid acyltransferase family protein [Prosthecochloris]MEC9487030.1 lysophospholipid acyltransferase family protein [Prosthecochloris sp.]MBF0585394.1 lysophospholipid acyltransferase family protein [Prosthecochloris ethylica]MBF0636180.1 lysophospholipid acyltransferase family protein [Prosthecochloris ethylica]NUK46623.1 1-acyl-sn-glycerol-3-phosphate acyltransferase [Prosthecochloris ethylica]RNA64764.1 glycerol acyltransferase [Prosthecochloris sp. ZM_2]
MLGVRRSRLYTRWFAWYSRRQFRRHFHTVRASVPAELQAMDEEVPVIFYGNHAYWWDGFWSQLCTEELFNQNLYIAIGYDELSKHRFFTRLGAFSIDRSDARSALRTVEYAAKLLSSPSTRQNALWIFPQGQIEHVDKRPLVFFRGTAGIASRVLEKKSAVYVVSVVSRIEYLAEQKPELFLSFGVPCMIRQGERVDRKQLTLTMQQRTEKHLDVVRQHIVERRLDGYRVLLQGSESVNRKVEKFRTVFGIRRSR